MLFSAIVGIKLLVEPCGTELCSSSLNLYSSPVIWERPYRILTAGGEGDDATRTSTAILLVPFVHILSRMNSNHNLFIQGSQFRSPFADCHCPSIINTASFRREISIPAYTDLIIKIIESLNFKESFISSI